MTAFVKYPPTLALHGSGQPSGIVAPGQVPFDQLDAVVTVEEKLDGTQIGLGFDEDANLRVQSRGHYVDLAAHEFHPLIPWIAAREDDLFDRLGSRYVLFAEWMHLKHTIFYDQLPSYLMEMDVYDREADLFLDTPGRRQLLAGLDIHAVPNLGRYPLRDAIAAFCAIMPSHLRSPCWFDVLADLALKRGLDPAVVLAQTDPTRYSEGLYVKCESAGRVTGRFKFVREDFVRLIVEGGTHWAHRARIPNLIRSTAA